MLVDIHARRKTLAPEYEVKTFYGQLENILVICLSAHAMSAFGSGPILLMAGIRQCEVNATNSMGFSIYSNMGQFEVVDMTCVQCLVGRIPNGKRWAIIDRTDTLQQSHYIIEE